MPEIKTTYRSYLLRLWHTEEPGAPWRAMLESVTEPGRRHYFKDLENLTAYLSTQQDDEPLEAEGDRDIEQTMNTKPTQGNVLNSNLPKEK